MKKVKIIGDVIFENNESYEIKFNKQTILILPKEICIDVTRKIKLKRILCK